MSTEENLAFSPEYSTSISKAPSGFRKLVRCLLNDGTGDGYRAYKQAYVYAGLDLYEKALERFGHASPGRVPDSRSAISAVHWPRISCRHGSVDTCPIARPHRDSLRAVQCDTTSPPVRPVLSDGCGERTGSSSSLEGDTGGQRSCRFHPERPRGQLVSAWLGHGEPAGVKPAGYALPPAG